MLQKSLLSIVLLFGLSSCSSALVKVTPTPLLAGPTSSDAELLDAPSDGLDIAKLLICRQVRGFEERVIGLTVFLAGEQQESMHGGCCIIEHENPPAASLFLPFSD